MTEKPTDGLWLAEFSTNDASGSGVVVLINGQILGGDANYYYTGTYRHVGSQLVADLFITHFAGPLTNIFGPVRNAHLKLEGAAGGDLIRAQGYDPNMPHRRASFRLRRAPGTGRIA